MAGAFTSIRALVWEAVNVTSRQELIGHEMVGKRVS